MVSLATLNPLSLRIAVAQLDEGGIGEGGDPAGLGDEGDADVGVDSDVGADGDALGRRTKPKSGQPAPDKALQTIDEFQRAKERASGTPEPEPTRRGGFTGTE
jgi:hypothetical protein